MASKDLDIDFSISRIWQSWQAFIIGKRSSPDIISYKHQLSHNLIELSTELQQGKYKHSSYQKFTLFDPKRREIVVATVKDRIVHRLIYDYIVPIWDKSFCFDAWSCRKGKGLLGAIERSGKNFKKYKDGWLWRSDIYKFFDNVEHSILRDLIQKKIQGSKIMKLLDDVIDSYHYKSADQNRGIAIGNLTSQIFANIYLNELDQFVLHAIKPFGYVRYGDDFVLWCKDELSAHEAQIVVTQFLTDHLLLKINPLHNHIQPVNNKLAFLGVEIWPNGRRLSPRIIRRIDERIDMSNATSYYSLVKYHQPTRYQKRFMHKIIDLIDDRL